MKFISHIIVETRNYDCYILYRKGAEPNKRRLDLLFGFEISLSILKIKQRSCS